VAEWISADAGTGASIESGNHKWAPIWADLMKAHEVIKNVRNSVKFNSNEKKQILKAVSFGVWLLMVNTSTS
jgi:hypothetical protein